MQIEYQNRESKKIKKIKATSIILDETKKQLIINRKDEENTKRINLKNQRIIGVLEE